jgi:YD repeat-containing protein
VPHEEFHFGFAPVRVLLVFHEIHAASSLRMQSDTACPQCGSWMPEGICPRCAAAGLPQSLEGPSLSRRPSRSRRVGIAATLLTILLFLFVHFAVNSITERIRTHRWQQTLARLVRQRGPVAPFSALQGKGAIYLVQLGPHQQTNRDTAYNLDDLAQWLRSKYALSVTVLPPKALDRTAWNPRRRQYIAERLNEQIQHDHPALAADPNAYLIGFTDAAMYPVHQNWSSTFTYRAWPRTAIISSRGMGDTFLERWRSDATAAAHLQARLRRILLKDVAILYWRLPLNDDPTSLLENTLDVDVPADDIYTTDLNPARGRWGRMEGEPCLFLSYSGKGGFQPLPGTSVRSCSEVGISSDPAVEIFEVDLRLGLLIDRHTDFYLPDSVPIRFERATRDGWSMPVAFGSSGTHNYDQFLASSNMRQIDVIHADGGRDSLERTPTWLPVLSWVKYVDANTGRLLELRWRPGPFEHFDLTSFGGDVETYLPCDKRSPPCYQVGYRDPQGRQLTFERDSRRRLMRLISPNRSFLSLSYGPGDRIAAITDSRGRIVHYTYNQRGQLITVAYPSGEVLSYTYDTTQHLLTFSAQPDATTASRLLLTNEYDHGLLVRQVLADGRTYTFSYSAAANQRILTATVHDPNGMTSEVRMRNANQSIVRERERQP